MDFETISKQLKALDRLEKLKILSLLAEEGKKSISAIARDLNIHFSTTHKYLEQLEAADLVQSKTVKEDRFKRYFYIKDFNICLSPNTLSNLEDAKKTNKTFKIITDEGEDGWFDENLFTLPYLEAGIPKMIINIGLEHIMRQKYEGITVLELRNLFQQAIQNVTNLINSSTDQILQQNIKKRTYISVLNYTNPELVKKHLKGDIFIQNLWKPRIFNFVHDIRAIGLHGINGVVAKNLKDLLKQILISIHIASDLGAKIQCLDSFNYFIAPYWDNNIDTIKEFFNEIKTEMHVGIDLGEPRFASEIPITFWAKGSQKHVVYSEYNETALKIAEILTEILRQKSSENIHLTYKLWSTKFTSMLPNSNCYVANMSSDWQGVNASYVGCTRFDSNWRGWMGSVRTGEVQNIVINLPRIAKLEGTTKKFLEKLQILITDLIEAYSDIAELTIGYFLKQKEIWPSSAQTKNWAYLPTEYSQYAISIIGLDEAVQLLSKKPLSSNEELGLEIIKTCSDLIKKQTYPFRIVLKGESSPQIISRFVCLDKEITGLVTYSPGVTCSDASISAKLHPYLNGGHCIYTDKTTLLKLSEFGLAKLN